VVAAYGFALSVREQPNAAFWLVSAAPIARRRGGFRGSFCRGSVEVRAAEIDPELT
jgi:hypothetical protein